MADEVFKSWSSKTKIILAWIMEIGPSLPPHLLKKKKEQSEESEKSETKVHMGPSLPPNFVERERKVEEEQDDDDDPYGPALPPHLAKARQSQRNVGSLLPGELDTLSSGKQTCQHYLKNRPKNVLLNNYALKNQVWTYIQFKKIFIVIKIYRFKLIFLIKSKKLLSGDIEVRHIETYVRVMLWQHLSPQQRECRQLTKKFLSVFVVTWPLLAQDLHKFIFSITLYPVLVMIK